MGLGCALASLPEQFFPLLGRYTCEERHPGLCYHKDRAIYTEVLKLSRRIESICTADRRAKWLFFWDQEQTVSMPLYFCEKRARRSFAPQAVVLAHATLLPSDEAEWSQIWFSELAGGFFEFTSVWSFAKNLILAGVKDLYCSVGVRRWVHAPGTFFSDSTLLVKWPGESRIQVWPVVVDEKDVKLDTTKIDGLLKPPAETKRAKPKSAGVDAWVGERAKPRKGKLKPKAAPARDDEDAAVLFEDADGEARSGSEDEVAAEPDEVPLPPPAEAPPPDVELGGVPAPPPPVPDRSFSSRAAGDYIVLPVPGGSLHFSPSLEQVNAHCGNPEHRRGAAKCKCDRRLKLASGNRRRPVGLLMAWLDSPCETREDHHSLKTQLAAELHFEKRASGRQLLETMAARDDADGRTAKAILDCEGDRAAGEPRVVR